MISDAALALERRIALELARRPECFVTHPTEVNALRALSPAEVTELAARNGWRVVRRLGGRQFQFYNDATARLLNETGTTPAAA